MVFCMSCKYSFYVVVFFTKIRIDLAPKNNINDSVDILTHALRHNSFRLNNKIYLNQDMMKHFYKHRPLHNMPMGKHELCLCGGLTKRDEPSPKYYGINLM